jgi:alkanesulfonate monooxygenase SsuD/methylene tetrahydromethanopterin reductase-like flavin-dependent oxidoreductase (luciferase family)
MKSSYFEGFRYFDRESARTEWPVHPAYHNREHGRATFEETGELCRMVEDAGFDWISISEHHYARTLTPSLAAAAGFLASHVQRVKIALLGPNMPLSNPVRVAEELAMIDHLCGGRLIVGMLRGTPNEFQVYSVNPAESRELTSEGLEVVLKAWTEPYSFSWEGRHYRYRSVAVWPRTFQVPFPPTYALGTSLETSDFAARHGLGIGVSFGPFEFVGRATQYYLEKCQMEGWEPDQERIIYRGNALIAKSDEEAQEAFLLQRQRATAAFPMRPTVLAAVSGVNPANPVPGSARERVFETPLPMTFIGGPDTIVEQVKQCREQVGAGVIDFFFQSASMDIETRRQQIELFGEKVLPKIQGI